MSFVRQFLNRDRAHTAPAECAEQVHVAAASPSREPTLHPQPSMHDLQIGLASDPGRVRSHNEDTVLAWQFTMTRQEEPPLLCGLFAVADGMGGLTQGEQASSLATRLAAGHIIRHVTLPLLSDGDTSLRAPIHEILRESVHIAHETVARRFSRAGTTMTLALMLGEAVYIAHAGDSRAYLGERDSFQLLTRDHSLAARLVEMGQAPQEVGDQRDVLYKAIGQGAEAEPDIVYHDLDWGQYLLLCCDGLWNQVADQEIAAILQRAPTPDVACQSLVAQANENGGEDNISVILIARGWPLPDRSRLRQNEVEARQPVSHYGV